METMAMKEEKKNSQFFCSLFEKITHVKRCRKEIDPEFIEKMKRGEQQVREGKTTKIDPANVWKSL
ncbi:MAG TPA: hypothetical protein PKX15_10780 [Bacteroidales bacterium]|nr:hypothetical protein [Bacteroidales bacterium]